MLWNSLTCLEYNMRTTPQLDKTTQPWVIALFIGIRFIGIRYVILWHWPMTFLPWSQDTWCHLGD